MENNKIIAEFMGFTQEKNIGWYDNDMLMSQNVYDSQDGNCFNELLFHTSWDWLMPVVMKISRKIDKPLDEVVSLLTEVGSDNIWDVKSLHNAVVEFINEYNQNN